MAWSTNCKIQIIVAFCVSQANHYYKLFITWTNQKIRSTFVQRNMFEFKHIKVGPITLLSFVTPSHSHTCTRTHTYTHIHTHACTHAHTCTHTHTHTRTRTYTHARTHTCTHAYMYTHTHTCMHARTCTHTHMHAHTHARMHAHTYSHLIARTSTTPVPWWCSPLQGCCMPASLSKSSRSGQRMRRTW